MTISEIIIAIAILDGPVIALIYYIWRKYAGLR